MIFVVDTHWKVNLINSLVDFVPLVALWCQDIVFLVGGLRGCKLL